MSTGRTFVTVWVVKLYDIATNGTNVDHLFRISGPVIQVFSICFKVECHLSIGLACGEYEGVLNFVIPSDLQMNCTRPESVSVPWSDLKYLGFPKGATQCWTNVLQTSSVFLERSGIARTYLEKSHCIVRMYLQPSLEACKGPTMSQLTTSLGADGTKDLWRTY